MRARSLAVLVVIAVAAAVGVIAALLGSTEVALAVLVALLGGIAKSVAGRGARTVARHCQQVLAGVGFTDEHEFHRYFRRVLAVDGLLGDARTLTRELGEELLRTRRVPAVPPL